jgi:putative sterol carrier protein
MSLSETTAAVRAKIGENSGLAASLKFDCGAEGIVHVDATVVPNVVTNEDKPADCTISLTREDLDALLAGALDPTSAFMMGKLSVDGDMNVAMRLAQVV